MTGSKSYLLIGNSRLHWACNQTDQWDFLDTSKNDASQQTLISNLVAWASVGAIPPNISLDKSLEINLNDVPLSCLPSWLGIDRALAAWGAYKKAILTSQMHHNGLLVADAGTVLSLTKINANGDFVGGQLSAGLHLQLKAMSEWTQNLLYPKNNIIPNERFPLTTEDSILKGTFESILATLIKAQSDANSPIWLCGGDAQILFQSLKKNNLEIFLHPNLALEGMIDLKT